MTANRFIEGRKAIENLYEASRLLHMNAEQHELMARSRTLLCEELATAEQQALEIANRDEQIRTLNGIIRKLEKPTASQAAAGEAQP